MGLLLYNAKVSLKLCADVARRTIFCTRSGGSTCIDTISCSTKSSPRLFFRKLPLPPHEGRIFDIVLPAPFPFAFSAPGALLHKLQVPLLLQVLIFVSHFTSPIVRFLRLMRFLRLPGLLGLLRLRISFVSFAYFLTSSAALVAGRLWGDYDEIVHHYNIEKNSPTSIFPDSSLLSCK